MPRKDCMNRRNNILITHMDGFHHLNGVSVFTSQAKQKLKITLFAKIYVVIKNFKPNSWC